MSPQNLICLEGVWVLVAELSTHGFIAECPVGKQGPGQRDRSLRTESGRDVFLFLALLVCFSASGLP